MPEEYVEKAAQGRVWPAETALRLGLVDGIGDLQDAIRSAAEKADLTAYDVIYLEKPLSPRDQVIRQLNRFITSDFIPAQRSWRGADTLGFLLFQLEDLLQLNDPNGLYAYCLMCSGN